MHDSANCHNGKIWDFFNFFLLRLFLFLGVVIVLATPELSFKSSDLGSTLTTSVTLPTAALMSVSFFLLLPKVTKLELSWDDTFELEGLPVQSSFTV
jgi:hypothetical protein